MSDLARKAVAEAVGTAFLTMAVIGSGIAAVRLSPDDVGLELLENSLVTGAALVALILTFQSISAAFNPVVTLVEAILERRSPRETTALVAAQLVGAAAGAIAANLMFGLDAVTIAARSRSGGGIWLAEAIATVGLVLVIFGPARSGRATTIAYAVGGYIAAAYWFTSSTSFANPALTLARTLSDSFAGIAPASVPMFVLMQLLGGAAALVLVRLLWSEVRQETSRP